MIICGGKSNKNVHAFIMLPPDAKEAIELLLETRDDVGIPSKNKFIFARLNAETPMAGHTDLRDIVEKVPNLEKPERIQSTRLRKYIATVSQVLHPCFQLRPSSSMHAFVCLSSVCNTSLPT